MGVGLLNPYTDNSDYYYKHHQHFYLANHMRPFLIRKLDYISYYSSLQPIYLNVILTL
jgi:hypothetical protein